MTVIGDVLARLKVYAPDVHDFVDIILLTVIVYFLLKLTQETRASQVLKGFGIVIIGAQICEAFNLAGVSWVLGYVIDNFALVLVVIFAPQLRQAMEQLGRGKVISIRGEERQDPMRTVDAVVNACRALSATKTGALIVLQRRNPLGDILESGTHLDAAVSAPLLENIFVVNTPLHDGAVIIHNERILAANCILPLTSNTDLSQDMGTRHRAALGMSEATDALIVVVSEETGIISMAENGRLMRYLDEHSLRELLQDAFVAEVEKPALMERLKQWRKQHVDRS